MTIAIYSKSVTISDCHCTTAKVSSVLLPRGLVPGPVVDLVDGGGVVDAPVHEPCVVHRVARPWNRNKTTEVCDKL